MAWLFRNSSAAVETATTTLTLTEPAGTAADYLLVACIALRTTSTTSITLPAGWTRVGEQKVNNTLTTTSAVASGCMAYIVRGASAPSYAFTIPSGVTVALGQVVSYSGNATTTPLDVATAATTAINTTAVSVTGLTTTQDDDLIVAMTAGGQEATWSAFNATTPSGASGAGNNINAPDGTTWRERKETVTTTGADTSLAIFDALKTTAGATGNLTATASLGAGHVVIAGAFKILPPSTADAWNANDKSATITLSASDKTATTTSTAAAGVRSTTMWMNGAAGKYYAEFVCADQVGTNYRVGIIGSSISLTASTGHFYTRAVDGGINVNGVSSGIALGAFTDGDLICVAWDAGTEQVWFRKNGGNWNNSGTADPVTGAGGIDVSFATAITHGLWFHGGLSGGLGDSATIRTELAEYTQSVPSGFTSWMGEVPPTVDGWNPADATPASFTLSNADKTATVTATPAGIRSTTKRLNGTAGKYYAEFLLGTSPSNTRVGLLDGTKSLDTTFGTIDVANFNGGITINGTVSGNIGACTTGDVVCIAWDAGTETVWFRRNADNWNASGSADPGAGSGGLNCSFSASVTHGLWARMAVTLGAVITLRTELAEFTQTVPSGFSSWMGEAPASVNVTVSVTGNSVTASVGTVTVATVQSLPTLVGAYQGGLGSATAAANWAQELDAATRTTASFNVEAGDLLLVMAASEDDAFTFAAAGPSGGSLSYSLLENPTPGDSFPRVMAWSALVDSAKSMTVALVNDGGTVSRAWGFIVYHFHASTALAVGAAESGGAASTAPSLGITTTADNSAIVYISADWNAVDGASRTWRTINSITPTSGNGLEKNYYRDGSRYTTYSAYWNDAGTSGANTAGLSAPSGQNAAYIAIEVKLAGGGITASVTGNSVTTSVGTPTVATVANVSTTLTGNQIAVATNDVTAIGRIPVTASVTGNSATVAVDQVTVAAKANSSTTTNLATMAVGTATVSAKANSSTTGLQSVVSVGDVSVSTTARVDVSTTLTGQEITAAVGTASASGQIGVSTTLTGLPVATAVGTAIASVRTSQTVTGQAAAVSIGTVTATGKAVASTAGQAVATSVGDVTVVARVVATVSVTGQAVVVSVGTASVSAIQNVSVPVTGEQLSIGATGVSVSAGGSVATSVTSQAVAVAAGDVIVRHNARTDVTGQTTAVSVGTITATGKASAPVGGLEITAAVGTASATGKAVLQVSGQQVTATLGNVSVTAGGSVVVGVTGLEITAAMGSPTVVAYGNETLPPAYRSGDGSTYAGGRTTTLVSRPAGVIVGDLLVAIVFCGRSGSLPSDPVPPAGWTQIEAASAINDGSFYGKSTLWWRRAGGSEPATYTWSHAETVSTQAAIAAYSGCLASGDPVDAASLNFANTGFAMATGITTTVANTTLVYAGNNWSGSGTLDAPLGMTERFDSLVYLADQDWETASATDNRHQSLAGFNPWTAFLIALKPQPLPYGHTVARVTGKSVTARVGKIVPQHSGIAYPGEIPPGLSVPPPTAGTSGTLTPYTGPMVITADGTLIANQLIDGMLTIQADNVTVSNCRLTSGDFWGIWCDTHDDISYDGLTVDHCTIIGTGEGQAAVLTGSNWTVTNCDISSWDNGIMVQDQGGLAEGNYIHDLGTIEGGHVDGIQLAGLQQGVVIRGNWVEAFHTSCVFIKSDYGPIDDVVVEFNTLINKPGERTAYPVYSYDDGGGAITNILIRSNRMEEGAGGYVRVQNSTPVISGNVDFYTDELIIDNTTVLPPVLIPMVGSAVEVGAVTVAVAGAVAVDVTGLELAVSVGSVTVTTGAEIPVTPPGGMPWYGRPSGIPKKELKKAVRELLKRQEKRKKRRKPKEIAREIIAAIEPQGLGVAEKRIVIRLISQALLSELPQMFYSEPLIHDKGEIERAILFIIEAAMQRILDEEEDEEAALLLLSAA